jgi:hypothetical protein
MAVKLDAQTAARRAIRQGVADTAVPDVDGSEDFSALGVAELRKRLKAAGLPVSGKKDELVKRLSAA